MAQPIDGNGHLEDMKFFPVLSILLLTVSAFGQQTYLVHGTIKDPAGAVISGLALLENDKYTGAVTDINGDFEIKLASGNHVLTLGRFYELRLFLRIEDDGLNPDKIELVVDPSRVSAGIAFPKPVLLPKPPYPPAARATRTRGEVIIAVKIDRHGDVISAEIESGHILLKGSSLATAKSAHFEPSSEVERKSRITYVFLDCEEKRRDGITRYSSPYRVELESTCEINY